MSAEAHSHLANLYGFISLATAGDDTHRCVRTAAIWARESNERASRTLRTICDSRPQQRRYQLFCRRWEDNEKHLGREISISKHNKHYTWQTFADNINPYFSPPYYTDKSDTVVQGHIWALDKAGQQCWMRLDAYSTIGKFMLKPIPLLC